MQTDPGKVFHIPTEEETAAYEPAAYGHYLEARRHSQRAIRYAREGFPMTELIAYYLKGNARSLRRFPGFQEVYMPGGRTPEKGEAFRNPELADTLPEARAATLLSIAGRAAEVLANKFGDASGETLLLRGLSGRDYMMQSSALALGAIKSKAAVAPPSE